MGLKRTIEPASMPVSLAEAKAHCRVSHGSEDTLITGLIVAAESMVEDYIGRSLMTQTWRYTPGGLARRIELPRGPVQSITAFEYVDSDEVTQVVDAALYAEDFDANPPALERKPDQIWPVLGNVVTPVSITYVTGYAVLPGAIKQAILMLVANWYSNREAILTGGSAVEMPFGTMKLLRPFRLPQI